MAITNLFVPTGKFDEFEYHPCKVVDEDKNLKKEIQSIEQCEPEEAEFWSVYVHLIGGGLDCIADCATEDEAKQLIEILEYVRIFGKV